MLLLAACQQSGGHMPRNHRLAAVVLATLLCIPATVSAGCPQHRLNGSWRTYFLPSAGNWIACDLKTGRDGAIKAGSTCVGSRMAPSSASGALSITNCVITGQIITGTRRYAIRHASFNIDQSQITGILALNNGRFVEFTSAKQ